MNAPDPVTKLLVCRRASDPIELGSERGYFCAVCKTEVVLSPTGRLQRDEGPVVILCNPCGFALAEPHAQCGTIAGVVLNPACIRGLAERQEAEIREKAKANPQCDVCGAGVDEYWKWKTRPVCSLRRLMGRSVEVPAAEWALCTACRPLWVDKDAHALAARAEILLKPGPGFVAHLEALYEAAIAAIEAGPTLVEVVGK